MTQGEQPPKGNEYTEEDISREAEEYRQERIAVGYQNPDEFEGGGLYGNFLNNFHGHLPGGYKYKIGLNPNLDKLDGDIDKVINDLGFDAQEIEQLNSRRSALPEEKAKMLVIQKALYIEMRKLGYTHSELTS